MEIVMNHFSDLHFDSNTNLKKLEKLKDKLLISSPRYIFFTGDLLNSNTEQANKKIDYLLKWLEELSSNSKLFVMKGNHDIMSRNASNDGWESDFDPALWNEISSMRNVYYLENSTYSDDVIFVSGIDLPFEYYENYSKKEDASILNKTLDINKSLLSKLPDSKLKICMCHPPRFLTTINSLEYLKEFDLILSGHEHNGMVPRFLDKSFKGTKGLINTSRELFPDNVRGIKKVLYEDHLITHIINGGISKIPKESKLGMFSFLYPMEFQTIKYDEQNKHIMIKKMY